MLDEDQRSTGRDVVALVTAARAHDSVSLELLARTCRAPQSVAVSTGRLLGTVLHRAAERSGTRAEDLLKELQSGLAEEQAVAEEVALLLAWTALHGDVSSDGLELGPDAPEVLVALARLTAGGLETYHRLGGVPPEWMLKSLGLSFAA